MPEAIVGIMPEVTVEIIPEAMAGIITEVLVPAGTRERHRLKTKTRDLTVSQ